MLFSMPLKCPITTLSVVVEFTVVLELLPTLSFQIGERGGNHRTRSGDQSRCDSSVNPRSIKAVSATNAL